MDLRLYPTAAAAGTRHSCYSNIKLFSPPLFLSRTVDKILQTCSVVKKSTPQAAAKEVIAISDIFKLRLTVIATSDEYQGPAYLMVPPPVSDWDL